jgi:hypothetical protein
VETSSIRNQWCARRRRYRMRCRKCSAVMEHQRWRALCRHGMARCAANAFRVMDSRAPAHPRWSLREARRGRRPEIEAATSARISPLELAEVLARPLKYTIRGRS